MIRTVIFILLMVFTISSCQNDNTSATDAVKPQAAFFDLKAYFQQEEERLSSLAQIRKQTQVGEEQEVQTIDQPDLKAELDIFTQSDINKIAWLDKYQVDTTWYQVGQMKQLTYQAIDEKLKTKRLHIDFQPDGQVIQIDILRSNTSLIASLEQRLNYRPQEGYRIESRQQTSISDESALVVDVQFLMTPTDPR